MPRRSYILAPLVLALAIASAAAQSPAEFAAGPVERLPPVEELAPPGAGEPIAEPGADGADAAKAVGEALGEKSFWVSYWDPWEGNVELGLNGTNGNSETFNVRLGATAKHKTPTLERSIQLVFLDKSADGVSTARNALVDGRLDWPWPESRWNYFVHGLMEYDEFKAFDVRLSGDTGFGYEFIQNDATKLVGRAGLSASHEIGGPDDDVNPEMLFGVEYKHAFSDRHKILFKSDFYPTITDFGDFRLNSQAAWEISVAPEWGLSLKLSVIDRYDSTPHGARPNDVDYSTLVIWSF